MGLKHLHCVFLLISIVAPLLPSNALSHRLTLTDETGREVSFPFPPKRLLSLAPNVTEILFSLGLDDEIVGVSLHCNFPERAKAKVRVGSYVSLDFERILSLKPDLIIGTGAGNTREMVERLERFGFPIYIVFPKNLEEIFSSIDHLGQVVGRKREALKAIRNMRERQQKVIERTRNLPRPKVFLQIGEAPTVTVGKGSFADDLIRQAGGINIAGDEKKMYPRWGIEEILKRGPDVIIVSAMNPGADYERVLKEWSRWKTIPAVRKGRIHLIDSDLTDRPSPRIIDGLEEMARLLHPEQPKN